MPPATAITEPARVELYNLKDDGRMPNNTALPAMVYHGALRPAEDGGDDDPARIFEETFAANGWRGSWRDGIFPYHHYHSTSHEVLGIARGEARVRLGGDAGVTTEVRAGDVIVSIDAAATTTSARGRWRPSRRSRCRLLTPCTAPRVP